MIYTKQLISDLRNAFGLGLKLPYAVWYSDAPEGEEVALPHCMFDAMPLLEQGAIVTFSKEKLHCGGGRIYCGYNRYIPSIGKFVSGTEHYKQTPEMVTQWVESMGMTLQDKPYLNIARIDRLETLDGTEGIVFMAHPDVIAGLWSWACYDNNAPDAVSCPFASGCATFITYITIENRNRGHRTFLGMLDLSVRTKVGPNEMSFAIPLCRLEEMVKTLPECALTLSPAWQKVKSRIENSNMP